MLKTYGAKYLHESKQDQSRYSKKHKEGPLYHALFYSQINESATFFCEIDTYFNCMIIHYSSVLKRRLATWAHYPREVGRIWEKNTARG